MSKEIIVNAKKDQTRIAIVEDGDLAELYIENTEHERTIGNIMLGRVRKVMPSIQAAFVHIGQDSDAFLHFSDVSDTLPEALDFLSMSKPKVEEVSLRGQEEKGGGSSSKKGKRRHPKGQKKGKKSSKGGGKRRGQGDAQRRKGRRSAQKRYKKRNSPSPEKILKNGQKILVKISKEPISNKGSRVSTDLSIAGRFLVLVPFTEFVAVSKKITRSKERRRLKALAHSLLPKGFGAIVRTVAEGRDAKSLDTDLKLLLERWRRLEKALAKNPDPPVVLHEDVDMASSIIRDQFSSDYRRVLVDRPGLHRSIHSYVQAVAPQMARSVHLHTGEASVFEAANIENQIDRAFERRVELPSGGYLFIERTEAMHVIDVNSGRSGKGKSQEKNSLDVDLEAARVVARQTRLRDLGGIIVVDFIDLRSRKNRKKVYEELKKEFKRDRAVTKLLPMSDFGLIQITRQRLRPSITSTFSADGSALEENGAPTDEHASSVTDETGSPMRQAREDELRHLRREVSRLKEELSDPRERAEKLKQEVRRVRASAQEHEHTTKKLKQKLERYREDAESSKEDAKRLKERARQASKEAEEKAKRARRKFTGEGVAPDRLSGTLETWLEKYAASGRGHALTLKLHPYAAAYLKRSVPSYPVQWFMRHLVRVRIEADTECPPLDFQFEDPRSGEILEEPSHSAPASEEKADRDGVAKGADTETAEGSGRAGGEEADREPARVGS